jgi:hypothetical protein
MPGISESRLQCTPDEKFPVVAPEFDAAGSINFESVQNLIARSVPNARALGTSKLTLEFLHRRLHFAARSALPLSGESSMTSSADLLRPSEH